MSIQTPRERENVNVSWDVEQEWLDELIADSGRVTKFVAGASVGGRPLNVLGVGATTAPAVPNGTNHAGGILLIGFQHGMEISGREIAFHVLRDLAYTTDPDTLAYLADRPVWVMPTASADRVPFTDMAVGGRENLDGVDLNRDHMRLASPEAVAIQDAMRLLRPAAVLDLHEGASDPYDYQIGHVTNRRVPAGARTWSEDTSASVLAATDAAGQYVGGPWSSLEWPGMFRNAGGFQHAMSVIIEVRIQNRTIPFRIACGADASMKVIEVHRDNAAAIESELAQGRADAPSLAGANVFFTGEALSNFTVTPGPVAYRLTPAQYTATADHRRVYGVAATYEGDGAWLVDLAQESAPVIPYLFDDRSEYGPLYEAGAERLLEYPAPPQPDNLVPGFVPISWGPVRVDGMDAEVKSVHVQRGAELATIYES